MRKHILLFGGLFGGFFFAPNSNAQLVVTGGTITIGDNAFIAVQGDLTSNADILGNGKIVMNGTSAQQMNMNGFTVSNLEINSTANVVLASDAKIAGGLTFTNGKIQTGNFNFTLTNTSTVTGAGAGKFVETNGTGQLRKEITAAGNYSLPVGAGANYMPLQYQITGGTIGAGAYVATRLVGTTHPNKPIRATDNLPSYWKPTYNAITGATVNAVGTYVDGAGVNGTETLLNGIRYNGTDWSLANSSINTISNTVTFNSVAATGMDLYAMDKFLLVNAKAFLQGAYNTTTGKMRDDLRTPTNLIPLSDPYRTAPYSTSFTHTNNPTPEVAAASVFTTKAVDDNNIVDWVFLELRNTSNTLIQTRSALLQKDGDIVDIDGVNPVYFNNLDAGNFIVTVRHRNHLGLAADASTYAKALSVANPSVANKFDFTTATDAQLFGTSAAYNVTNAVNLLWAGNVNSDIQVKYNGPKNDKDEMLKALGGVQGTILSNVYNSADLNMNRYVQYNGPKNDKDFMLATPLAGSQGTIRNQALPN